MHQVKFIYYQIFFSFLPSYLQISIKRKIDRQVAKKWNDLTRKQLFQIIHLIHSQAGATTNVSIGSNSYKLKLGLLKILLQFRFYHLLSLTPVQVCNISWLTDFIFKDLSLTKNLIPTIRIKFKTFYGPGDLLKNLTFAEFIVAESYYMAYIKTKNSNPMLATSAGSASSGNMHLHKLIATLYRPKRKDYNPFSPDYKGDIREEFNDHLIAARAVGMQGLATDYKQAILLFYQGCRQQLTIKYKEPFSGEESNAKVSNPWLLMIGAIPSEKFGTIPQIEKNLLHQVLFHLNQMMIENKERKRQQEAANQY